MRSKQGRQAEMGHECDCPGSRICPLSERERERRDIWPEASMLKKHQHTSCSLNMAEKQYSLQQNDLYLPVETITHTHNDNPVRPKHAQFIIQLFFA